MSLTIFREALLRYGLVKKAPCSVWPDWAIYWILDNFLNPLATIKLPKSPTFLGNFCNGVKMHHFSSEMIFGQLLSTFSDFYLFTLTPLDKRTGRILTIQFECFISALLMLLKDMFMTSSFFSIHQYACKNSVT